MNCRLLNRIFVIPADDLRLYGNFRVCSHGFQVPNRYIACHPEPAQTRDVCPLSYFIKKQSKDTPVDYPIYPAQVVGNRAPGETTML
jgi:hypothetical protein